MAQIIDTIKSTVVASAKSKTDSTIRRRRDILELQNEYNAGNKKPLSDLLRAWQYIQQVEFSDYFSYFTIAGYHGEPFRGAGWGNPSWWGGYCNHGNVLFPTWHRAYLYRLENALRKAPNCQDVTLPYWNEVAYGSVDDTIPWIFLRETVELDDGSVIANPLHSYKFQRQVSDNLAYPDIVFDNKAKSGDQIMNPLYIKDKDYVTKRYPFSGFSDDQAYNDEITALGQKDVDHILCQNVYNWINLGFDNQDGSKPVATRQKYLECLKAPTYTLFSNTSSARQWNQDNPCEYVMPLESPHNDIHLAVGGFNVAEDPDVNQPLYPRANGDMGENNTASFDPIFFFHHCFVDKTFWEWQKGHANKDGKPCTEKLEVEETYPGTNSVDNQGPTPGIPGNTWLDMTTPLQPFKYDDDPNAATITSKDVVNIETQLNYTYADPVSPQPPLVGAPTPAPAKFHAHVSGVNRGQIAGSFIIAAYKQDVQTKKKTLVGQEAVLSRWATEGCANCQNHLHVRAHFPLHGLTEDDISGANKKYDIVAHLVTRSSFNENQKIPPPKVVPVKVAPSK